VYARATSDNIASLRVLEKAGFRRVGVDRGFARGRGEEIEETILRLDCVSRQTDAMIIVVEGVSAAGKTTWCRTYFPDQTVEEQPPASEVEQRLSEIDLEGFWVARNAARWHEANRVEVETGLAICDTDPFKLHYTWSLWRIGQIPESRWRLAVSVAGRAFEDGSLGLADLFLIADASPSELRRRREADLQSIGRNRGKFELHLLLREALHDWYDAVERLDPGRVHHELPMDGRLPSNPDPRMPRSGRRVV
jgi:hypothetical protein